MNPELTRSRVVEDPFCPGYYGKSGTGKSYEAGADIETIIIEHEVPTILLDKKDDHIELAKELNFELVTVDPEFIKNVSSPEFWAEYIQGFLENTGFNGLWVGFDDQSTFSQSDLMKLGNDIAGGMWKIRKSVDNLFCFYEELKNYCPDRASREDIFFIYQGVTEGRTDGLIIGGASQKPKQVSHYIREEFNFLKVFYLGETSKTPYNKLSINKETRQEMMSWGLKDRNQWFLDEVEDINGFYCSEGLERRTTHNG